MFKNLFSNQGSKSKTGFFKIENNTLIPIDELAGNGSINDCIETIGFPTNHINTVHIFDSEKISCIGFVAFTRNPKLVLAENSDIKISISDVERAMKSIDWSSVYSEHNVEEILQEGIEKENLEIEFLKSTISLVKEDDGLYKANNLGLFLQFDNGKLTAFSSSEWDNSSTKWLKRINSYMVEKMIEEAKLFHKGEFEIMQEVNNQAEALQNVPDALNNEHISEHTNSMGNINFYNLVIAHYTQDCNKDDFLFMNKGRYREVNDHTFEVGGFIYQFDGNKNLVNVSPGSR